MGKLHQETGTTHTVVHERHAREIVSRGGERSGTPGKILAEALVLFGANGFAQTSLDQIAAALGIRKQTVLYWYPSKEVLRDTVIERAVEIVGMRLIAVASKATTPWDRVESIVRETFRLAVLHPEVIGVLREAGRVGSKEARCLRDCAAPYVNAAVERLNEDMRSGAFRSYDAGFFLLSAYSMVVGLATERSALKALGMSQSTRAFLKRRRDAIQLLRLALLHEV